jgi:hypothetical protein
MLDDALRKEYCQGSGIISRDRVRTVSGSDDGGIERVINFEQRQLGQYTVNGS